MITNGGAQVRRITMIICSEVSEPEAAAALAAHLHNEGIVVHFICERLRAAEKLTQAGLDAVYLWRDDFPADREAAERGPALVAGRTQEIAWPEMRFLEWEETPENERRLTRRVDVAAARIYQLLRDNPPAFVMQNEGPEIIRRVTEEVSRALGIPNFYFGWAPFPGRMALIHDFMGSWCTNPEPDQSFDAQAFIDRMKEQRPVLISQYKEPFGAKLRRYARRLVREPMEERDERDRELHRGALEDVRMGSGVRARAFAARKYYRELPDGPFVYFPMHVWSDSQVTVRAYPYFRQKFLIDVIARSLPDGVSLVVKEHPAGIGWTPVEDLRFISSLNRVRLVPPRTNSHEIIMRAGAVAVLNSTVGFETLLHGKPTVVLAEPFYSGRGLTIDLRDLHKTRDALRTAFGMGPIEPEAIRAFVASLHAATWPGAALGMGMASAAFGGSPDEAFRATAGTLRRVYDIVERGELGALGVGPAHPAH